LALRWSWMTGRCCAEIEIRTRLLSRRNRPQASNWWVVVNCWRQAKCFWRGQAARARRRDAGSNVPNVSTDV